MQTWWTWSRSIFAWTLATDRKKKEAKQVKPSVVSLFPRRATCCMVCDVCHVADELIVIGHVCATTGEAGMIRLFRRNRRHPAIPVNGPERHALVRGIIFWPPIGISVVSAPNSLEAYLPMNCKQRHQNKECMGTVCPLYGQQRESVGTGIILRQTQVIVSFEKIYGTYFNINRQLL